MSKLKLKTVEKSFNSNRLDENSYLIIKRLLTSTDNKHYEMAKTLYNQNIIKKR